MSDDLPPSSWGQPIGPGAGPVGPRGGPSAGSGAPMPDQPPTVPPPPPARRSRRWPWLLPLLLLPVVLIGGCVAVVISLARAPIDATNEFVALLADGRVDQAYDRLCPDTRADVSPEDFAAETALADSITGYTFSSLATGPNDMAMVSGTIEFDDVPRAVDLQLIEQGDDWFVCSFTPFDS